MATPDGYSKEYTSASAADAGASGTWTGNNATWVLIIGAGVTVLVVRDGSTAITITTDAAEPNAVIPGKYAGFTSTTAARVRMGTGLVPRLPPPSTNALNMRPVANMTALQALALTASNDGQSFLLQSDGSVWRYAAASVLTTDTSGPFLVATATTAGAGAFLRVAGGAIDLQFPVSSATADGATLYTVPTGFRLRLTVPFWSVSVTFTTGSAGAAALKSSNAGLATAGDILGGAGGDLVATLVSTGAYAKGTVGVKIGKPAAVLSAGDTIVFNLVAGTYTAGTGIAHIPVEVLLAPAA